MTVQRFDKMCPTQCKSLMTHQVQQRTGIQNDTRINNYTIYDEKS